MNRGWREAEAFHAELEGKLGEEGEWRELLAVATACTAIPLPSATPEAVNRMDRRFQQAFAEHQASGRRVTAKGPRWLRGGVALALFALGTTSAAAAAGYTPADVAEGTATLFREAAGLVFERAADPPPADGREASAAERETATPSSLGGTPVASNSPAGTPLATGAVGDAPAPRIAATTGPGSATPGSTASATPTPKPVKTATPAPAFIPQPTAPPPLPPTATPAAAPTATPTPRPETATSTPTATPTAAASPTPTATPSPAQTPSATPTAPAATPTPSPSPTPSPTATPAPPPTNWVYSAGNAGTVTLSVGQAWVTVVAVSPAPGWSYVIDKAAGSDVQVKFSNGPGSVQFWAGVEDGAVTVHLEESGP